MTFGSRYEHPSFPGVKLVGGRTKQSFREECDINGIMARYNRTGLLPRSRLAGCYGDVSALTSYQDGLDLVGRIDDAFNALPAAVRSRFRNDPMSLLSFLSDPSNYHEAVQLGLIDKTTAVGPAPVQDTGVTHLRRSILEVEMGMNSKGWISLALEILKVVATALVTGGVVSVNPFG